MTRSIPLFRRLCRAAPPASLLTATAAWAQAAAPETPGVSTSAIVQMLIGLVVIIGLLFAGAYLLRRLNDGRSFGHSGPLKVIGGLSLSARERIVLVEIEDTWLVVGIVPGQIKTLHTLPKGELPPGTRPTMPFANWLKQLTERPHER